MGSFLNNDVFYDFSRLKIWSDCIKSVKITDASLFVEGCC
jgi:hypothetical protein